MPSAPPKHQRASIGRQHNAGQKQYDRKRGSAAKRGYGYRWQQYSMRFRAQHPICAVSGCNKLSEHVDHIKAVSGADDPLFWDAGNHQALCASHHSKKTAREDGGFGHERTR